MSFSPNDSGAHIEPIKIAVLGNKGCGKTAIIEQFVFQKFSEAYTPTVKKHTYHPFVIVDNHLYELCIMDFPHLNYFPKTNSNEWANFRGYGLRYATAYLLVYDISSRESFSYVQQIREQILESRDSDDVDIFVIGTKHDKERERVIPLREVVNIVKKHWKCGYIECSSKYNWHIVSIFKELMKHLNEKDNAQHKPASMRMQDVLRRNKCVIL